MTPSEIVSHIVTQLDSVAPKTSWGETSLFYNPGRRLPHGVYFCTIKDHDGANDRASHLNRAGVFRVAIGLSEPTSRSLTSSASTPNLLIF